ncbi:serine hydrolase [Defluviimonas sp. WL0075]|uniref:Serine hydrolase n=1 Tax=Albidovulum sediminicola TaxID=2984331 RepID=A0ABT2YX48_9RHOB|nr:serine hydrolase [Defluviimonas sp. WL0075]MCV2863458.1 serine hydrolase [Defluviimonas sp. WL0075]
MGSKQTAPAGTRVKGIIRNLIVGLALALAPVAGVAAPYADYVIDARTGQVLHEKNSDARLHPASLTKMMTLYIAFEAIERGEISLDTKVTVSKHAASQPPSRLGLKPGQKIALRYLIRAAAIKSANDAATAIGEAIEGSEPAFAKRMTRTAKALGMSKTSFRNANGLTAEGHLSTAHDMTMLGRHLFFDFPQYYNLFSRRWADAGVAKVASTNRRFLEAYEGADGIKTGYTVAAGFNLVASAQRGNKRIIATVFGGTSTAQRNERVAQLLDIGFGKAPNRAVVQKPAAPNYAVADGGEPGGAGKIIRLSGAVKTARKPIARPVPGAAPAAPPEELLLAMQENIDSVLEAVQSADAPPAPAPAEIAQAAIAALETVAVPTPPEGTPQPVARPAAVETVALAAAEPAAPEPAAEAPQDTAEAAPVEEPAVILAAAALTDDIQRPVARPGAAEPAETVVVAAAEEAPVEASTPELPPETVAAADAPEVLDLPAVATAVEETTVAALDTPRETMTPIARALPERVILAAADAAPPDAAEPLEIVTRVSTSGGRQWAINVGNYPSRYEAERRLLQTALMEMNTLDEALRKVVPRRGGFDANFVGMTEETAQLACRRLVARNADCEVVAP